MATTPISNAFISVNDIVNNFIISYTGPGKIIPDSKRTEIIFHARRCLQEFAYETIKSQFTEGPTPVSGPQTLGKALSIEYLSNALTTDESAAIPKLAEEAMYVCMVYAILSNREKTDLNTLQRLLIEKTDKLERAKSRLVFTNFS